MDTTVVYTAGLIIGSSVTLIWLVSVAMRNVSIVDIWWGPGFSVIAWTVVAMTPEPSVRIHAMTGILTLWGLRLGLYLGRRNLGHPEDKRYVEIRGGNPQFWWTSLFKVFYLQGGLQLLIALPVFYAGSSTQHPSVLDALGGLIALAGVAIEAIADAQLTQFKREPDSQGKVMRRGLWGWSRHPNYFGNAVLWLGIGLMALSGGAPLWSLFGPVVMWFLLLRVSGVSMLERTIVDRRPDYKRYINEVSAFVPWPPRTSSSSAPE